MSAANELWSAWFSQCQNETKALKSKTNSSNPRRYLSSVHFWVLHSCLQQARAAARLPSVTQFKYCFRGLRSLPSKYLGKSCCNINIVHKKKKKKLYPRPQVFGTAQWDCKQTTKQTSGHLFVFLPRMLCCGWRQLLTRARCERLFETAYRSCYPARYLHTHTHKLYICTNSWT